MSVRNLGSLCQERRRTRSTAEALAGQWTAWLRRGWEWVVGKVAGCGAGRGSAAGSVACVRFGWQDVWLRGCVDVCGCQMPIEVSAHDNWGAASGAGLVNSGSLLAEWSPGVGLRLSRARAESASESGSRKSHPLVLAWGGATWRSLKSRQRILASRSVASFGFLFRAAYLQAAPRVAIKNPSPPFFMANKRPAQGYSFRNCIFCLFFVFL